MSSGLVPCTVTEVEDALKPGPTVTIRITRTTGPYKRGERRTCYGHTVYPLTSVRKHKHGNHLLNDFIWMPKEIV